MNAIKWTSKTTYIDIDTGEILGHKINQNGYYKLSSKKTHTVVDEQNQTGTIHYDTLVRRRTANQLNIWPGRNEEKNTTRK